VQGEVGREGMVVGSGDGPCTVSGSPLTKSSMMLPAGMSPSVAS
jgi:hypothetical protein